MKQNTDAENKNRLYRYILGGVIIVVLLVINVIYFENKVSSNHALATHYTIEGDPMDIYRKPAVAGLFYPAEPQVLNDEIANYFGNDYKKHASQPRIVIVPHAGYQYSAEAVVQAYLPLQDYAEKIKTVILLGPSHYVALNGAALPLADYFKTPLGKVEINHEIVKALQKNKLFSVSAKAHKNEHSLEVQLPFLQKVLKNFDIVPLVYGDVEPQQLADVLKKYLKKSEVLLVVSADLSHYHDYDTAAKMDENTAEKIAQGQADVDYHHSCGAAGINTALLLGGYFHLKPEILALINSGDVSADKNRGVGYGAWSFSDNGKKLSTIEREYNGLKGFAKDYGEQIMSATRKALEQVVQNKTYRPQGSEYEEHLFDRGASFVTLTQKGNLRGCVGSLYPRQAIVADVVANAQKAAREDSRFSPLTEEDLATTNITVSLLTDYEKIHYQDEADLVRQLRPHIDGVVIRDGNRQGLFLPSVWEQISDRQSFLNNLKLKAGMSPSFWSNDIQVYRFRTVEVKEIGN